MENKSTGERLETFIFNESTIEHLHRYGIARDLAKNKAVLDLACGEGYGSNLLAESALSVIGIDIDPAAIDNATQKYKRNNLTFKQGNAEQVPSPDHSFDVVVSFETLEHVEDHERMLSEIKRVLKDDGLLIISTPEKKTYSDIPGYSNPFHKKELYEEQFKALIKKFFGYSHFLSQRLTLASAVVADGETSLKFYEGNFTTITAKEKFDPVYLVAIASDNKIDKPSSSLFSGQDILQTALQQKEKDIHGTLSYKIGHLILSPAKWLQRVFKK